METPWKVIQYQCTFICWVKKVNVQIGKLCQNDKDGDGEPDETDICPERSDISRMDDFRNIETMDLCKKDKVKSKLFMCQKYGV